MRATIARGVAHFSYTPLLAAAAAVSFGKLIVYAGLLDVAQFGALGKMLLVSTLFGMVGGLGLYLVASRDLPALLVVGRARRAVALLLQSAWVTTLTAAVGLLGAYLGIGLFDLSSIELALGLLHGWMQQLFMFMGFDNRSRLALVDYARDLLVRALLCAGVGAAAAVLGSGAVGIILAEAAATALAVAWLTRGVVRRAQVHWRWLPRLATRGLVRLPWRSSFVLLTGSLVAFASFNLDRWIAAETLDREAFGQYAFAWIALLAAQSVQMLVNSGLLPLLARRSAMAQGGGAVGLTFRTSAALLAAACVVGVVAGVAVTLTVERTLPRYAAALPLLPPIIAAAALRASDFWSSLLIVQKRENELLAVQTFSVIVCLAGFALWTRLNGGSPEPIALAWLACATAALSLTASAAIALGRPST
jgi:O-antigen/teichoic acid export membrane protein